MSETLASVRLREVIRIARLRGATDVHLCAGSLPAIRVNGELEFQSTAVLGAEEVLAAATALLPPRALQTLTEKGDSTVTCRTEDAGSIRVHAYRTSSGTALALRLLATAVPTLEALQLPPAVASFATRLHGIVIFAGPTGSGKSTALAAVLDRINRTRASHILTIEDPVEYEHIPDRSVIHQREAGVDVGTFAEAIYGALRSDPDVLLVGEMRTAETMHAAMTAAETGHLVLTTLHTGDCAQTIDRIVGAFQGDMQRQIRIQLAQTLVGVVCLRLVPRADGCGRVAAVEVLIASDAVRNVIRDGKTHQLRNIVSTSRQAGMQTLEQHLTELVARGEITLQAAIAATDRDFELAAPELTPA